MRPWGTPLTVLAFEPAPAEGMSRRFAAFLVAALAVGVFAFYMLYFVIPTCACPAPYTLRDSVVLVVNPWNGDQARVDFPAVRSNTIAWTAVTLHIGSPDGTVFYIGPPGHQDTTNGTTTNITFTEASESGRGMVSPDDMLLVAVSPHGAHTHLSGASLFLVFQSEDIGQAQLP